MRDARWALWAAIFAGVSYAASWSLPLAPEFSTAWKGAGVGLLAVYAALQARDTDGWLLAAVMAFGALGDVLLETSGLTVGAASFLAGHLTAVALYLRTLREPVSVRAWTRTIALVPMVAFLADRLPADRSAAPAAALYAAGLGAMAATAWISRFPRALTGLGALMFLASDMLIFVRTGRPRMHQLGVDLAVWGLYFVGQTLIVLGVTRVLAAQPDRLVRPAIQAQSRKVGTQNGNTP